MKPSFYNITVKNDNESTIVFNTITRRFIKVNNHIIDDVLDILRHPDANTANNIVGDFIMNAENAGLIVPNETDELKEVKSIFNDYVKSRACQIVIMTTYSCNFSCWYCLQRHQNIRLDSATRKRVKSYINHIANSDIDEIHLSWFGGEPLLNTESIVDICEHTQRLCSIHNLQFSCSITTNGSLLSVKTLSCFSRFPFKSFQVTLDGDKETHNKTRKNKHITDSYTLILNNVASIAKVFPDALIILRINYTADNLNNFNVNEIDSVISGVKRSIRILFRKVWQEKITANMRETVLGLTRKFKDMGYSVYHDYADFSLSSCYVERHNYLSIFPDGTVDLCNNKPLVSARGHLTNDGHIQWDVPPQERKNNIFSVESECISCKYLPLCMGPCPKMRETIDARGYISCYLPDKEKYFADEIKDYRVLCE